MDSVIPISQGCAKTWLMLANHTGISDRTHPMKQIHLQATKRAGDAQSSRAETRCPQAEPPEMPPRDDPPGSLGILASELQQTQS